MGEAVVKVSLDLISTKIFFNEATVIKVLPQNAIEDEMRVVSFVIIGPEFPEHVEGKPFEEVAATVKMSEIGKVSEFVEIQFTPTGKQR